MEQKERVIVYIDGFNMYFGLKESGEIKMQPFQLANLNGVPDEFKQVVTSMLSQLSTINGTAFLTVDGRIVSEKNTHRRGGAHIDGNYIPEMNGWGGNGWKVGEGGRQLNSIEHARSYQAETGGMLMASTYPACKGWNGFFEGNPGIGGDCTHVKLTEGFLMDANILYYGNSQFIHESLPIDKTIHRTIIRITLPEQTPVLI